MLSQSAATNSATSSDLTWHDRIQIGLAIADTTLLKSLLTDCYPAIAQPQQIGSVLSTIGIPTAIGNATGLLKVETIHCVLIQSQADLDQGVWNYTNRSGNGELDLTCYESKMQTLGKMISLSQAIALLSHGEFSAEQIRVILQLPHDAWFRSWWYAVDETGEFTVPFLRMLRTRRHVDGTYTIQYKDFFSKEEPKCFKSEEQSLLIDIRDEAVGFRYTLETINNFRQALNVERAILIGDRPSDLEVKGFTSQNISLYSAMSFELLPPANCFACLTADCPMRGDMRSPVLSCHRFSS
jgi:hypothetical protein